MLSTTKTPGEDSGQARRPSRCSFITWNQVIFRSAPARHLKQLDTAFFFACTALSRGVCFATWTRSATTARPTSAFA